MVAPGKPIAPAFNLVPACPDCTAATLSVAIRYPFQPAGMVRLNLPVNEKAVPRLSRGQEKRMGFIRLH
jgi:hypothetical protein